jgi:hypothetical protein
MVLVDSSLELKFIRLSVCDRVNTIIARLTIKFAPSFGGRCAQQERYMFTNNFRETHTQRGLRKLRLAVKFMALETSIPSRLTRETINKRREGHVNAQLSPPKVSDLLGLLY